MPLRRIYLSSYSQSADIIWASIQRAVTDAGRKIRFSTVAANVGDAGKGYGELKRIIADLIIMTLSPIQERYYALMDDQTALDALLQKGAGTARERAVVRLRTAKERVGLGALPRVEEQRPALLPSSLGHRGS